ncbi:MAG: hypothetical protein HC913_03020 [Microscillaceae bacterium]|nr:hypothetical protein [Microscillaceae bacterium]
MKTTLPYTLYFLTLSVLIVFSLPALCFGKPAPEPHYSQYKEVLDALAIADQDLPQWRQAIAAVSHYGKVIWRGQKMYYEGGLREWLILERETLRFKVPEWCWLRYLHEREQQSRLAKQGYALPASSKSNLFFQI